MGLGVFIADDEEEFRQILKKVIARQEGFELLGEAGDGETALQQIEVLRPQVVFLDVEMPRLSGIECAQRVFDLNPRTFIVFATAHEEYMTEAFQVYAFDYLVKPFKLDRLVQTLERLKAIQQGQTAPVTVPAPVPVKKGLSRLMIRNKESMSLVDTEDILLIQREDRSTVIYTSTDRHVTAESLGDLEERLDPSVFLRSHKSYIINLSMVSKISPYGRWTYIVKLKNTDRDALITHEKYEEMQKFYGI